MLVSSDRVGNGSQVKILRVDTKLITHKFTLRQILMMILVFMVTIFYVAAHAKVTSSTTCI